MDATSKWWRKAAANQTPFMKQKSWLFRWTKIEISITFKGIPVFYELHKNQISKQLNSTALETTNYTSYPDAYRNLEWNKKQWIK